MQKCRTIELSDYRYAFAWTFSSHLAKTIDIKWCGSNPPWRFCKMIGIKQICQVVFSMIQVSWLLNSIQCLWLVFPYTLASMLSPYWHVHVFDLAHLIKRIIVVNLNHLAKRLEDIFWHLLVFFPWDISHMVFIDGESVYMNALNVGNHKKCFTMYNLPNLYHHGIIIGFIFVK